MYKMGLLLNSGDSRCQAQGWGSCQFWCQEGIFSPRTDWQGTYKADGSIKRVKYGYDDYMDRLGWHLRAQQHYHDSVVPGTPQKSVHKPLVFSPSVPLNLSTKGWLWWTRWLDEERGNDSFYIFHIICFICVPKKSLTEALWGLAVGCLVLLCYFSCVSKECLKNMFQLPGRKKPERKREQRKAVEVFNWDNFSCSKWHRPCAQMFAKREMRKEEGRSFVLHNEFPN